MHPDHHEQYMRLALEQARAALLDKEFPVGCVLVRDNRVVARGRRQHSGGANRNELDHAEIVALRHFAASRPKKSAGPLAAYCTMEPCLMCHGALLLSGVTTIVYAYEDIMGGATGLRLAGLTPLYRQTEIDIVAHVLRRESLALFKQFFRDPANDYWQGSLLAKYTLAEPDAP
ncbi:MAG: nucleoside deaminase [Thermodesulfobacteriota bacterium]